jgi:hypothetical protein
MNTFVFGPWVGEFSYEVQWWIPEIRQIVSDFGGGYVVIVGYSGRDALYRDFANEYIPMPEMVLNYCDNPNCWGQREKNSRTIFLPNEALNFYESVCKQYDNPYKHIPHEGLLNRRYLDNPYGLYKNINSYNFNIQHILDNILMGFDKNKTICIVPKLRRRDAINIDHESWPIHIWEQIVDMFVNELEFNVLSFHFNALGMTPGTYDLTHLSKIYKKFKQIELNCENSLDIQIGLLKNTKFSLYGSTGAAILPIMCNTNMITYQIKESGWRLNFEWQKKLTNGHKFICIRDLYPAETYKNISITEIFNDIKNYIASLN